MLEKPNSLIAAAIFLAALGLYSWRRRRSELESWPSEDENGGQNGHIEENADAALVIQVLELSIPKEDIENRG